MEILLIPFLIGFPVGIFAERDRKLWAVIYFLFWIFVAVVIGTFIICKQGSISLTLSVAETIITIFATWLWMAFGFGISSLVSKFKGKPRWYIDC